MKNYTRKNDNYVGKIEYYQAELALAVKALEPAPHPMHTKRNALEMRNIKFYTSKIEYFLDRQAQGAACTCDEWQPVDIVRNL